MSVRVPATLEELRAASAEPNPVNIAGYGRESTHKGYLSWILSKDKNPLAQNLLQRLLSDSERQFCWNTATGIVCDFEQRIASHKVDLQVVLSGEDSISKRHLLPIELKTDSGPSGGTQFPEMSSHLLANECYLGGWVFCLGSSSVQDHDWGTFRAIGPEALLERWLPVYEKAPAFLRDWLDTLAIEVGRKRLALEVHRLSKDRPEAYWEFGYRNYKHLIYYVYASFREYLRSKGDSRVWQIYDGGYNAVMNLQAGSESWRSVPGLKDVRWFFEFNDNRFCLKLEQNAENADGVADWAGKCVLELKDVRSECPIRIKNRKTWKKGWPLLGDWEADFSDFRLLEAKINEIIEIYGEAGIMGKLSPRGI